jgi:nucleoid DNA-binding protein
MNKKDLINELSKVLNTKKNAREALDCVISSITTALKNEEAVTLLGFGTFKMVNRNARTGRNPQTGEEIKIAARKLPKFTPGKALKESLKS